MTTDDHGNCHKLPRITVVLPCMTMGDDLMTVADRGIAMA